LLASSNIRMKIRRADSLKISCNIVLRKNCRESFLQHGGATTSIGCQQVHTFVSKLITRESIIPNCVHGQLDSNISAISWKPKLRGIRPKLDTYRSPAPISWPVLSFYLREHLAHSCDERPGVAIIRRKRCRHVVRVEHEMSRRYCEYQ
jgi:hypothetical protein